MSSYSRILVVDDSDDARMITLAALEDGDFDRIEAAESASEAYRMLGLDESDDDGEPLFDIVLLDIVMPEVDGVEACARIRASRRYRDVPILMVSSQRETETLNQAFMAGANDYVLKPVGVIELLARVRSALRLKRELDRRRAREAELRTRTREISASADRPLLDESVGLPDRTALDAYVRALADDDRAAALAMLSIDDFTAYRAEHGDDAAARLARSVARALAGVPAPLGAMLFYHGEGVFTIAAPRDGASDIDGVGTAAQARIAELAMPHGSATNRDHVHLTFATGSAEGEALRALPGTLLGTGGALTSQDQITETAERA